MCVVSLTQTTLLISSPHLTLGLALVQMRNALFYVLCAGNELLMAAAFVSLYGSTWQLLSQAEGAVQWRSLLSIMDQVPDASVGH